MAKQKTPRTTRKNNHQKTSPAKARGINKDRNEKKKRANFRLAETHYQQLGEHKIFETETRIAKIFSVRDKNKGTEFINIKSRSYRPVYKPKFHWDWKFNFGVSLYNALHVGSMINGLRSLARQLGWQAIDQTQDIDSLKAKLREKEENILDLERENKEERKAHELLMERFKIQQEQILRKNRVGFEKDVEDLKELVEKAKNKNVKEEELQEFLYKHTWFFGTEYVNAEPQKLRGAHSRFDFYLERFNKTNDIVEIKLLSESVINKDGSISAKVIQAVDQLIGYMESSIAVAHNRVLSEEEGIRELRPRGVVIIGSDNSQPARDKLQMWNYQLAHISVWTYIDVIEKAEAVLKHLEKSQ